MVIETVRALTTTVLSTSTATITQGDSITLIATVAGSNSTGTVSFTDGSRTLGAPAYREVLSDSLYRVILNERFGLSGGQGQNRTADTRIFRSSEHCTQ